MTIAREIARALIMRKVPGPELIEPTRVRDIEPMLRYEEASDKVEMTLIGIFREQLVGFVRSPGIHTQSGKCPVQSPLHPSPSPLLPSSHSSSLT